MNAGGIRLIGLFYGHFGFLCFHYHFLSLFRVLLFVPVDFDHRICPAIEADLLFDWSLRGWHCLRGVATNRRSAYLSYRLRFAKRWYRLFARRSTGKIHARKQHGNLFGRWAAHDRQIVLCTLLYDGTNLLRSGERCHSQCHSRALSGRWNSAGCRRSTCPSHRGRFRATRLIAKMVLCRFDKCEHWPYQLLRCVLYERFTHRLQLPVYILARIEQLFANLRRTVEQKLEQRVV
uniref:Uncharacterized protein n=1 Tax=Anopheles melas TaxID=34690 RepID=A0A182UL86_9DIPT